MSEITREMENYFEANGTPKILRVKEPSELSPVAGSADFGSHVQKAFVIFIEPGKNPQKKGPFLNDDQVERMLLEMRPHYDAATQYIVAQVTHCFDLWLESASEWLLCREVERMPDDDPNSN